MFPQRVQIPSLTRYPGGAGTKLSPTGYQFPSGTSSPFCGMNTALHPESVHATRKISKKCKLLPQCDRRHLIDRPQLRPMPRHRATPQTQSHTCEMESRIKVSSDNTGLLTTVLPRLCRLLGSRSRCNCDSSRTRASLGRSKRTFTGRVAFHSACGSLRNN